MKKYFIYVMSLVIILSSCVSKKKYLESENLRQKSLKREATLKKDVNQLNSKVAELKDKVVVLENDTAKLGKSLRNYTLLNSKNESQLSQTQSELKARLKELEERERTIAELKANMQAQNKKLADLLSNVKQALLGFNTDELTVTEKNGKVYIAMSDKLLFASGSTKIDPRGVEALGSLAKVLTQQPDIDIMVEGHTDNIPIRNAQIKDNLDLSVLRATTVARILTKNYNVNENQVIPCGRGETMPIASNETAESRAKNRRTEIILAPKLEKLFELLQQ